jgi:hypothetical protein
MPLYLDEIWLEWHSPTEFEDTLRRFLAMGDGDFGYPEGVKVEAGPWFSNEERKIVLVLDIADHTKTFQAFGMAMSFGVVQKRRLQPIVPWSEVRQLSATLDKMRAG